MLEELYAPIDERVGRGEFTKAGGSQAYKDEVERLEREYTRVPHSQRGPCGETALLVFKKQKIDHQLESLLQTDKALSKEEKKREQLKREVKIKEEENAVLDRQQQEVMEQHQRDMEILQMNMRRESEEKERLMAEGFKQQADMMRDQVEATRKAMEEREQANREQQAAMMQTFTEQMAAMNERSNQQLKELIAQMPRPKSRCSIQ